MSEISIFIEKEHQPTQADLEEKLGKEQTQLWKTIRDFVWEQYPNAVEEWNFPGKKYGWSFRIKDKNRAIIYLLPREQAFKVAFVFGQKAYDYIMEYNIDEAIKEKLKNTHKYAEGRGISFPATTEIIHDIKKLVEIKLKY